MYKTIQRSLRLPLQTPPKQIIPGEDVVVELSQPLPTCGEHKPEVILDLFHAKKRLTGIARKTHGAYLSLCNDLTNALTITDPCFDDHESSRFRGLESGCGEDQPADEALASSAVLAEEYSLVLKHATRLIHILTFLIKRFDEVVKLYRDIKDIVAGERHRTTLT